MNDLDKKHFHSIWISTFRMLRLAFNHKSNMSKSIFVFIVSIYFRIPVWVFVVFRSQFPQISVGCWSIDAKLYFKSCHDYDSYGAWWLEFCVENIWFQINSEWNKLACWNVSWYESTWRRSYCWYQLNTRKSDRNSLIYEKIPCVFQSVTKI